MDRAFLYHIIRYIAAEITNGDVWVDLNEDSSTCMDYDFNVLVIGKDFNEDCPSFLNHIREIHEFDEVDEYCLALWTILHEIGHFVTQDEYDGEQDYNNRRALAYKSNATPYEYYNLESEYLATEFAIDFIETNTKDCKFYNHLLNACLS